MRLHWSCAAIVAAILMVSQAAIAGELFPKVLVMPAPLVPYVEEILHGAGHAGDLLRPGQEPHDFALAPTQAKAVDGADILIVPDLSINPVLARLVAKKKHLRVIELSKLDGAQPLPYTAENPFLKTIKATTETDAKKDTHAHHEHDENDAKDEKGAKAPDPHIWLDPERMAAIALPLASAIAQTAPEAKPTLTANAKTLATHLREELMPGLRAMLAKPTRTTNGMDLPEIPFITYHAAYQYFLTRFGLAHTGEITTRPEEMMGASTMHNLVAHADKQRVRCLIGEQETVLMKRIATATDAKIIILSPEQLVDRKTVDALDWLKSDYDRLLYVTVKAFAGCL